MNCFCGHREYRELFVASGREFLMVQCRACGQVRTETFEQGMRKQLYRPRDIEVYVDKEMYFRKLFCNIVVYIKRYKKTGRFVEIGAGVGLLVDEAQRAGFTASGFEPAKAGVQAAKKYFGVRLIPKLFSKSTLKGKADIIVLNHVLEHLPRPRQIIGEITATLTDKGILAIGVPNFGSIMSSLKKDNWQSLVPAQHRWQFTLKSLDALVASQGYRRLGYYSENHDRATYARWKQPVYWLLDQLALISGRGEAIFVVYEKI